MATISERREGLRKAFTHFSSHSDNVSMYINSYCGEWITLTLSGYELVDLEFRIKDVRIRKLGLQHLPISTPPALP